MKKLKILLSIAIPVLLVGGIVVAGGLKEKSDPQLGLFSDPFLSVQLADTPQNGYILQTDGTDNSWVANSGGGIADINSSQLGQLSDVNTTTLSVDDGIKWDGSEWTTAAYGGASAYSSNWEELYAGTLTPTSTSAGLFVYGSSTIDNDLRVNGMLRATSSLDFWLNASSTIVTENDFSGLADTWESTQNRWATDTEQYFWNSTSTWAGFSSEWNKYTNASSTLLTENDLTAEGFITDLSGFTTANLSENTNLYYTDARVRDYIQASTTIQTHFTNADEAQSWGNHADAGYGTSNWATADTQSFWNSTSTWAGFQSEWNKYTNASSTIITLADLNAQGYLTGNETITLSGDVTGSGATSITTSIANNIIDEANLEVTNAPTDNYILSYNSAGGNFTWVADQVGEAGSGITDINSSQLGQLSDVNTTTLAAWDILNWDGDSWENQATSTFLMDYELDTFSELQSLVSDATILSSGGTLTNTNLCVADGTSGAIDCNVTNNSGNWDTAYSSIWAESDEQAFWNGTSTWAGFKSEWDKYTNASSTIITAADLAAEGYITDLSAFTTANLSENTNLYYTDNRVRDFIQASTTIQTHFTNADTAYSWGDWSGEGFMTTADINTFSELDTIVADQSLCYDGGAFHDGFSDYVANEHIDWTIDQGATNINAGNYTDTNTTYTAGTNITLVSTTFNVDDAFVINSGNDTMTGVLTADGLTLGANENITLGAQTLDHNGTDFVFNDSLQIGGGATSTRLDVTDTTHGMRVIPGATTTLEFY